MQPRYVHFISNYLLSTIQSYGYIDNEVIIYICDYGVDVDMHPSVYACVITRDFFQLCLCIYIYMYSTFVRLEMNRAIFFSFFFSI